MRRRRRVAYFTAGGFILGLAVLMTIVAPSAIGRSGAVTGARNGAYTGVLQVTKRLRPPSDPGRFNLRIDGVIKKVNAGDGGTTGGVVVPVGAHTVSESPSANFQTGHLYRARIDCSDGSHSGAPILRGVVVAPYQRVVCTITNFRLGR